MPTVTVDEYRPKKSPAEKLAAKKPWRRVSRSNMSRKRVWTCRVREKREALKLAIRDVAEAVKLSVAGLWEIEHGSDPMLTTARKLADFFGATIEELWPVREAERGQ